MLERRERTGSRTWRGRRTGAARLGAPAGHRSGLVLVIVLVLVLGGAAVAAGQGVTVATATPAGAAAARGLSGSDFAQTWSRILPDVGGPIALSSPVPVTLSGRPGLVVGDRSGYVWGLDLADGSTAPGFPINETGGPVDSTPSVAATGPTGTAVLFGAGNDAAPTYGGYRAFTSTGASLWSAPVDNPPSDVSDDQGVQAGLTVGPLQGAQDAFAGSLGQVQTAMDAGDGATLTGWPYLNTDSTHGTAALADLYGTGQSELVVTSDQSAGLAMGQSFTAGGHLRVLTARGAEVCRADSDQVLDSSPAVGGFLSGGATGIVTGTGSFFPGASDSDTVLAYTTRCQPAWRAHLDGSTYSSPALSDVLGNGALQVVEGTNTGTGGSVYVLDGTTGAVDWQVDGLPLVIGSVVTADLSGAGYDDVIVPTVDGTYVLDGRTHATVAVLSPHLGLQNSPLVTVDPDGRIGITLAGYIASPQSPNGVGEVVHYEITGSDGAAGLGTGAWPMFHHDPQLTGDAGGTPGRGSVPACQVPSAVYDGYSLVAADGGMFTFPGNGTPFCGSTGGLRLTAPIVGMAEAPGSGGYWLVAADGGVFAFGGAGFYGSMARHPLNRPIVGMAATPDGGGYWLVASDGGVFAFGDAHYDGSTGGMALVRPIVGVTASPNGQGYLLVASDGGVFAFGDARFQGSTGGLALNRPIVGITTDPGSGGYWLVASDGGIFAFGGAAFHGSTGALALARPVVGIAQTSNGSGYRLAASDGGVFSFAAPFFGSAGALDLARPVVGAAGF